MSYIRPIIIAALTILAFSAGAVEAQTYTVQSITGADLGKVVSAPAGQGDSVFRFAASSGLVSKVSGNAVRVTSGTTRAEVTIKCSNSSLCSTPGATITVTPGAATKRARPLTNLTVAPGSGITLGSVVTNATNGAITFTMSGIPRNGTGIFYVGADIGVADDTNSGITGLASAAFTAATATSSLASSAAVIALRQISVAPGDSLEFGSIIRPTSGSNIVAISEATGARSISGGGNGSLLSSTSRRATFSVSGEGGQTFSITAPATFDMTRAGGGTITVNLVRSATSGTLGSALGAAGTTEFGVGGNFSVTSATVVGSYSGTFTVTVSYN